MFVIAMERERNLLPNGADYIVTGEGALNVISVLGPFDRNIPIINIGYAGSNKIPIGTRVKIGKVKLYHPNVKIDEPEYDLDGDVPCFTSCDFVTGTEVDAPCVFDMELAYILAMGFKNVSSEKIVSDNLNLTQFCEVSNGATEN